MRDKIIRFAIIGCGRVAGHHSHSIDKIPQAKMAAFCDLVEERAAFLAKETNVPYYTNYHEMFNKHPEIDIVCIATPSGMHFEHMQDVITRYKKHIVIEKPMVMTLQQGHKIKKIADTNGVQIFPVFQNRFNKAIQRVKTAVNNKELGDLVSASIRIWWYRPQKYYDRDPWRGTFSMDGGAMTNQGVHFIDLLRYLVGEVERTSALLTTKGVDIEVENNATALLKFKNGASGVIEITTAAYPKDFEASLSIIGTKGMAMIGGIATNKLLVFSPDPSQEAVYSEEFPTIYGFGHLDILRGVVESLANNDSRGLISFDDALETIRVLHALYRSDELNRWVKVDRNCSSKRLGRPNDKIAEPYRTYPEPGKNL